MKKTLIGLASILILIVITLYITTRPAKTANGTYSPSPLALKLATSSSTNFDNTIYENKYTGNKKVLMICTEERNMTMANGKKFSTGNHPVEMLLPVLHLKNAGFDVDVVTPTGKPVAVEMWAMPEDDENVKNIYAEFRNKLEKPGSLADFVTNSLIDSTNYVAIFFPGGHGAMLGLPENKDVSNLVNWSYKKGLFTLAICHGPAALLAASLEVNGDDFIYKGYTPGKMPWIYGEKLNKLGVTIINKEADNTVNIDRKLITGASPQAANDFGKLAANELLKEVNR